MRNAGGMGLLGPQPAGPPECSQGPVRYSTGEIMHQVTDLAGGGYGLAWGHTRSFLSRIYKDTDFGQGYDWQVAQWPYLNLALDSGIPGATYMGQAGKIVWFDFNATSGTFTPRYGVQLSLVHDAANHVYSLADQWGNVTLFDDATLLFKSRSDAAGNTVRAVSYVGAKNLGEVQRSFTDGSGNTTVESFLYSYAAGSDGIERLTSVLLRRQVNGGAWSNVRQALYTYWDGTNSFGSLGDLKTVEVQNWTAGAWASLGKTLYRYYVAPAISSSSSSSGSSSISSSSSSSGPAGPAVFNHGLKFIVEPDSYARLPRRRGGGLPPSWRSTTRCGCTAR